MGSSKHLGILLFTTPYSAETTDSAIRMARSALEQGHKVTIFAYADSVHNFTKGQKAVGIPNAEKEFQLLIEKGLNVELCGTCLRFRGIEEDLIVSGAKPSSMQNLNALIDDCDRFITLV